MDEDEEEDVQPQRRGVHRAVFPRDFGRQSAKDVEKRVQAVMSYAPCPFLRLACIILFCCDRGRKCMLCLP